MSVVDLSRANIVARLWAHMRSIWPRYTLWPAVPFLAWCLYCVVLRGEHRWELYAVMLGVPPLAYANATSKRLFIALLPFGLVGLLYDSMRFVKNVGLSAATVHVCDLRQHEMDLFGMTVGGQRATVHDWFQAHWSPVLDAVCAIPYGTYLFIPLGYAIFLYTRDYTTVQRYMWAFFVLNVVGFATYHLYPAAPPWYFHKAGCTVDLGARAYEGANLARVDRWLGYSYFAGLYGRSNDIFGAVPSLHVAYPFLMVIEGWRHHRTPGRSLIVLFFVATCFAAVYLDHHWIIDVVIGLLYTAVVHLALRWIFAARAHPTDRPAPTSRPTFHPGGSPPGDPSGASA